MLVPHIDLGVRTLLYYFYPAKCSTFPRSIKYSPAAQPTHAAEPGSFLYVPPGHAEHGPPCGPVNSALQVQLLRLVLPAGEEEPSGHEMQFPVSDELDGPSLYVSAGQRVQGPNGSIWQRYGRD